MSLFFNKARLQGIWESVLDAEAPPPLSFEKQLPHCRITGRKLENILVDVPCLVSEYFMVFR